MDISTLQGGGQQHHPHERHRPRATPYHGAAPLGQGQSEPHTGSIILIGEATNETVAAGMIDVSQHEGLDANRASAQYFRWR